MRLRISGSKTHKGKALGKVFKSSLSFLLSGCFFSLSFPSVLYAKNIHIKTASSNTVISKATHQKNNLSKTPIYKKLDGGYLYVQFYIVDIPDDKKQSDKFNEDIKKYISDGNVLGDAGPINVLKQSDKIDSHRLKSTRYMLTNLKSKNLVLFVGEGTIPYKKDNMLTISKIYSVKYKKIKTISIINSQSVNASTISTMDFGYKLAASLYDVDKSPYVNVKCALEYIYPVNNKKIYLKHDKVFDKKPDVKTQFIYQNVKMDNGQTYWFNAPQEGKTYDNHHTMIVIGVTPMIRK